MILWILNVCVCVCVCVCVVFNAIARGNSIIVEARHFERVISRVARSLVRHTERSRLGIVGTGYGNSYQCVRASVARGDRARTVLLRAKIFNRSPPAGIYDAKNLVSSAGISPISRAARLAIELTDRPYRKSEQLSRTASRSLGTNAISIDIEFVEKDVARFRFDSFPLEIRN